MKNCLYCTIELVRKATEGTRDWGNRKYCSYTCHQAMPKITYQRVCPQCEVEFEGASKDKRKIFCTHSCAATFNNQRKVKKVKEEKPKRIRGTTRLTREKGTIHSNNIRTLAREAVKHMVKVCAVCGYDTHVQVCHIKPVKDFPNNATVAEINIMSNLVLLCPNHHWELDNGKLIL